MSGTNTFDETAVFEIFGKKRKLTLEELEKYYSTIGIPNSKFLAKDSFAYGLALKSVDENEGKAETLYWTYKALDMSLAIAIHNSVGIGMDYFTPTLNPAQKSMAKNLPNEMLALLMHNGEVETYYGREIKSIIGEERSINPAESEVSTNGQYYTDTVRMFMAGDVKDVSLSDLTEYYKNLCVPRADLVAKDVIATSIEREKNIDEKDVKSALAAFYESEVALRCPDYQKGDLYRRAGDCDKLPHEEYLKLLIGRVPDDLLRLMDADSFIHGRWGKLIQDKIGNKTKRAEAPTDPTDPSEPELY